MKLTHLKQCSKKFYDDVDLPNHLKHFCRKPHLEKEPNLSDNEEEKTVEKVITEVADKSEEGALEALQ